MIKGKQSLAFEQTPYLTCAASVAGKKEGEGPLGALFDYVEKEDLFGENSWEAAEGAMQKMACSLAAERPAIESSSFWAMRTASSSTSCSFSGLYWLRLKR